MRATRGFKKISMKAGDLCERTNERLETANRTSYAHARLKPCCGEVSGPPLVSTQFWEGRNRYARPLRETENRSPSPQRGEGWGEGVRDFVSGLCPLTPTLSPRGE